MLFHEKVCVTQTNMHIHSLKVKLLQFYDDAFHSPARQERRFLLQRCD